MPSFAATIPVGVTTFPASGGYPLADNLTVIKYSLADWPQANRTIALQFFISINGGPFLDAGGTNPDGGAHGIGRDGTTDSSAIFRLPPGINRQGKVTATVVGGSITTTLNVTAV